MDTGKMKSTANGKPLSFPCAACKIRRRKCGEMCVFAPYFPLENPDKFTTVHRVFGAGNIRKMLQDLPNDRRAVAVSSMLYEANARLRDPVYGCAGTIHQLQHKISQLQSLLATAQAELSNMRLQQANLLSLFHTSTQEGRSNCPSNATTELYSKCLEGAAVFPQSGRGFIPPYHLQQVFSPSQIAQVQTESPGFMLHFVRHSRQLYQNGCAENSSPNEQKNLFKPVPIRAVYSTNLIDILGGSQDQM